MTREDAVRRAEVHAPYLAQSLLLFPDLGPRFLSDDPVLICAGLMDEISPEIGDLETEMAQLRTLKRRTHLITALSDIANVWGWADVTEKLTQLSDFCMYRLLTAAAREIGLDAEQDNPVPGLFILALGKYGARELNYSSDIDFIVLYDPDIVTVPRPERMERTLVKLVQKLIRGFETMTPEGYIFRTDLRLRPDPRSNAVAVSTLTAERYYETWGQNWERAAMIKARVCGGDRASGAEFIDTVLTPYIWRRNLDYAAIEDIHSIKRQIHAGKGGHTIDPAGHHLKLGIGGIREIEFYAQVQQLILGGRNPDLRTPRTVEALKALSEADFIDADTAQILTDYYALLRKLEHAAQMRKDEQTHIAPKDNDARFDLAALAGFDDLGTFDDALTRCLQDVHRLYVDLFPDAETLSSKAGSLVFTGVEPEPETLATFAALGYERGPDVWHHMADWLGGRIAATKTERARELLTRLAPTLIDVCSETGRPDQAFFAFARFFSKVQGGVSLLSMFVQNHDRLKQITEMMVSSMRVADMLGEQPRILDAMVDPNFLAVDTSGLTEGYHQAISLTEDFEDALNAIRRCVREDHFRVSASVLLGTTPIADCAAIFTAIADAAISAMLPVARRETERTQGPIDGDFAVLGLGKLGGGELNLSSDLDIMIIYQPSDASSTAHRTFTKLTQRLISALSAVTAEGGLFEVDMDLRPSGRSGPVAVSLNAFTSYYADKAWTWEFMALTRARVIAASSDDFARALNAATRTALTSERGDLDMPFDIQDMLRRVKREKTPDGAWDIKNLDGGLRDVEFIAQSLYLNDRAVFSQAGVKSTADMLTHAELTGALPAKHSNKLQEAAQFYLTLAQAFAITRGGTKGDVSEPSLAAVSRVLGTDASSLISRKNKTLKTVQRLTAQYISKA